MSQINNDHTAHKERTKGRETQQQKKTENRKEWRTITQTEIVRASVPFYLTYSIELLATLLLWLKGFCVLANARHCGAANTLSLLSISSINILIRLGFVSSPFFDFFVEISLAYRIWVQRQNLCCQKCARNKVKFNLILWKTFYIADEREGLYSDLLVNNQAAPSVQNVADTDKTQRQ